MGKVSGINIEKRARHELASVCSDEFVNGLNVDINPGDSNSEWWTYIKDTKRSVLPPAPAPAGEPLLLHYSARAAVATWFALRTALQLRARALMRYGGDFVRWCGTLVVDGTPQARAAVSTIFGKASDSARPTRSLSLGTAISSRSC